MKFTNKTKVGLTTLIALFVLAMIISWKSEIFLTARGYKMVGSFENIEGLTIGSEVRYRGFNVGKVMDIDPTPHDIKVYCRIKRGIKIPADSNLRIAFDGLVGLKYLEVRPGTLEALYQENMPLKGKSTAGIVDFIDIGSKNLMETKAIFENIKNLVSNPALQKAIVDSIFTINQVAGDMKKLTEELRATNAGIMSITTDSNFQNAIKGTASETHRTLSSANNFFEGFAKLRPYPSGDILIGSANNQVRGNLDIVQAPGDYLRFGIGEGPAATRDLGLHDIILAKKLNQRFGLKLGMMNSRLGGGVDLYNNNWIISGDVYDINNPKPKVPKFRVTSSFGWNQYVDFLLQADDFLNPERNYSFGISVKSSN